MLFSYSARDPLGKMHDGSLDAASRDEAMQKLYRDGFQVLKLAEDDTGFNLIPRRVKKSEIVYTTSQLAIMVDTGINLATALSSLHEQEENPTLQRILGSLKSDVESGEDLSAALAKHPKQFDKTYTTLVKASERTGTLGQMLEHIAFYMRKELDSISKVKSAMAYPVIMMMLATGVTIFLLTYIMPKFTPLFSRKGMKLPAITSVMMSVSTSLTHNWHFWAIGLVAMAVGMFFFRRSRAGRMVIDRIKISVPLVGTAVRKVILSRNIRTLGTLLESSVPLLESLQLTAEVSGNYYYEAAWLKVKDAVTNGDRVASSLTGNRLFPKTLVQMIGSGEETGKLDYVLKKVSVYYDNEVETTIKTCTSMIEPLIISVMGGVVGTIALSLLLPIFTLSRSAH